MNLYEAIYGRRDIRDFVPDAVPDEVLARILRAAHHAGSVGFMQPWNFIVLRSRAVREKVYDVFCKANREAASQFAGARADLYVSLKLQGILDAPVNLVVTCDRERHGPAVLGRNTVRDTDVYSTCCAIQNLWLAARAEGVGVGWVSILDLDEVKACLGIPSNILLVAYLCVGYPRAFADRPMLEEVGWQKRLPVEEVVFEDGWQQRSSLFSDSTEQRR